MRRTLASPSPAISSKIALACLWDVLSASIRTARSGVSLAMYEYLRRQPVTAGPPIPDRPEGVAAQEGGFLDIDVAGERQADGRRAHRDAAEGDGQPVAFGHGEGREEIGRAGHEGDEHIGPAAKFGQV